MNHGESTDPRGVAAPSSGLGLDDVYFTFFRHTRIILICLGLGLLGALAAKLITPSIYSSKAKLRVSYVVEDIPPSGMSPGENTRVVSPSSQDSILNSEVEILTSRDVAFLAAQMVGPEKVLAAYGGGNNTNAAAAVIRFNLTATAPRRSDVVSVTFEHRDPDLVRPILNAVIRTYLEKHAEIHLGPDESEEYVSHQLAGLRKQLVDIEDELDQLLRTNKLVSPAETRRLYLTQIERLTSELLTARTTLALKQARFGGGDSGASTSQPAAPAAVPPDIVKEYSMVIGRLEHLEALEQKYNKDGLKPLHPFRVDANKEITERLQERAKLERLYPMLARLTATTNGVTVSAEAELAEIDQLKSIIRVYEKEINDLQLEAANVSRLEPRIQDLQRLHDEREADYKRLSHRAKGVDGGANNVPGVKIVENPTPPARSDKKMLKLAAAAFGGFLFLGIALAVALDYVFDRTIKRSVDVERNFRQRVFYTIPHTFWSRRKHRNEAKKNSAVERKRPGHVKKTEVENEKDGGLATWQAHDQLREHAEGLRERIVTYFEINGLYHKPKLIAVTSCHENSGVTSITSSLAAALSLTGDGNVMLVDLCTDGGSVTSFYRGKPGCGLNEAVGLEDPMGAEPGDKLVVTKTSDTDATYENLARVLPTYFKQSMPKLKTSGYDYILFDLPPVSQTSVTPRLSSQMDMVLMILESEKTGQPMAKQATTLMREAHANLFYVLNKCRRHVPERLSYEL